MLSASTHAHTISFFSFCLSSKCNLSRSSMAASSVRIAVVGDVHDCWNLEEDSKALELLQEWPISVSYGAIAGYLVALVASCGFVLVHGRSQHVKRD